MTEGLDLVIRFAFADLGLHRLEANIQPANTASLKLVARLGFRREGHSPSFQLIDGVWQDHERWAITSDMMPPASTSSGSPAVGVALQQRSAE
ncbi:GNAT family N-acetyltransferase [Streptomyces sp. NPDC048527]|uniref:GNAT family N-acetyltransferase n=1 Tax=Streptomyces sp. NPDC048527 TaxID=3365568 RepID=UPI003717E501